jgi:hypothetical protein
MMMTNELRIFCAFNPYAIVLGNIKQNILVFVHFECSHENPISFCAPSKQPSGSCLVIALGCFSILFVTIFSWHRFSLQTSRRFGRFTNQPAPTPHSRQQVSTFAVIWNAGLLLILFLVAHCLCCFSCTVLLRWVTLHLLRSHSAGHLRRKRI